MSAQGTFILADISGYTRFVASVAIEHSNEIIGHLLNAMLKANSGQWNVANIEGDCIFFYREGREEAPGALCPNPAKEEIDHGIHTLLETESRSQPYTMAALSRKSSNAP